MLNQRVFTLPDFGTTFLECGKHRLFEHARRHFLQRKRAERHCLVCWNRVSALALGPMVAISPPGFLPNELFTSSITLLVLHRRIALASWSPHTNILAYAFSKCVLRRHAHPPTNRARPSRPANTPHFHDYHSQSPTPQQWPTKSPSMRLSPT